MLDDIGLGSAIANTIYVFLIAMAIIGLIFFFRKKTYLLATAWFLTTLNVFFYLFFMGTYTSYPDFVYMLITKIWPLINIVLVIVLIFNMIKNKNAKTK